jgi:hypothetical protein
MSKVSITLHRDGNSCVIAALGDRTGNFLLRKAMRSFEDGEPVALATLDVSGKRKREPTCNWLSS